MKHMAMKDTEVSLGAEGPQEHCLLHRKLLHRGWPGMKPQRRFLEKAWRTLQEDEQTRDGRNKLNKLGYTTPVSSSSSKSTNPGSPLQLLGVFTPEMALFTPDSWCQFQD